MMLSTTTLIVVAANGLTMILTAALLMLVLWQAPRQRANQLFAGVMLALCVYSGLNAFGRFVGNLNVDPAPVFYLATSVYGVFVVAIFFFASEFARTHTSTVRVMRNVGVVLAVLQGVALWTGKVTTDIQPVSSGDGGYRWDFTTLGLLATGTLAAYLLISAVVLYRLADERGRSLWPAPALVIASAASAALIWPVVPIPLSAIFLAGAASVMGRQVLRYALFNPLADLHAELAQKNRALQETNRLKSQFLANMSHELRTPLNSIIGYTELVINGTYGTLNDTQRDRLSKVIRNGHHLLSLINDVLDLNKIDSGRVILDWQPLSTPALLDSVLATIEPLAARKGLVIQRDYADAPSLYADDTRTRQIMTNIVANAVKFTREGSVTVRASGSGAWVQLEIVDTGIGISPEHYETVFAEFHQLDNSSTREFEGTGLGLAITQKLVELHGGRIWLESVPDRGTTFFVTLPAAGPSASSS